MNMYVSSCLYTYACMYARACVRAYVRVCVCMYMHERIL